MTFAEVSVSNTPHFPVNFRGQINPCIPLLRNTTTFLCGTNVIRKPVWTLKNSNGGSVTVTSTDSENQVTFGSVHRKFWVHFVGVGGCGLSALAMLALTQGFDVSGSDISWSYFMDGLRDAGARLYLGHSVLNLQKNSGSKLPDAIVVSSAIPKNNVEILLAKSAGVPVYKRDSWLGMLTERYNLIAVSGSHGKSTTTGMLAYVLKAMGEDLTAVVGANVRQFGTGNIISGGGQTFVLEADEYDGCFLGLSPYISVVTNLDWEHVDIFQDEAVKTIFRSFLRQIRVGGHLILCGDSEGAYSLLSDRKPATVLDYSNGAVMNPSSDLCGDSYNVTTYGISSSNEWHASSILPNSQGGSNYILCHRGQPVADISLRIPGVHNVSNSLAVIASVIALVGGRKPTYETINCMRLHLNNFIGLSRRFEMIGTFNNCHIYDDYAHHPTEVRAVLQAARQKFPFKYLLVVFQPHTYSRVAALKNDFATAFVDADQVVFTAIYPARETNIWNVSGRDLATNIWNVSGRDLATSTIGLPSEYIHSLADVVDKIVIQIYEEPYREFVVLTLGAGDITTVGPKLLHALQQRLQKLNT